MCEGDTQSELIKSTLRILEETVDDFRLLASTSPAGSTATHSRSSTYAESADCSSSEQDAVHTADAAALVSRSSGACGTSCCSSNWLADASSSSTHPSKPQGSSRLSRSSSAGCNLQALGTWGAAQALSSSSSSWQHNTAAWEGAASSNPCCDDEADLEHGDSFATGFASETLHHKLSSPDRYVMLLLLLLNSAQQPCIRDCWQPMHFKAQTSCIAFAHSPAASHACIQGCVQLNSALVMY